MMVVASHGPPGSALDLSLQDGLGRSANSGRNSSAATTTRTVLSILVLIVGSCRLPFETRMSTAWENRVLG